jgi:hypothetical protein
MRPSPLVILYVIVIDKLNIPLNQNILATLYIPKFMTYFIPFCVVHFAPSFAVLMGDAPVYPLYHNFVNISTVSQADLLKAPSGRELAP